MLPEAPPPSRDRHERDDGYALVVAVIAVTAFAYLAFQVLAANVGAMALASGRVRQTRLAAAADAGISLAIHGLAANDRGARWSIDGNPRQLEFDGVDLTITVEDERGKAPLNSLNDDQARALFAAAGATGERLDDLAREFRDWRRQDTTEPNAGSAATPAGVVRGGPLRTTGELAALKDMTPAIFARIAPSVTVFFEESGPFDPGKAGPIAQAAMGAQVLGDAEAMAHAAGIDRRHPDLELGSERRFIGRTLTVSVVARGRDGARTHRTEIVELTGNPAEPYWVRYAD